MTDTPRTSTVKVAAAIDDAFAQLPAIQAQLSGMQALMFAPLMPFAPQLRSMVLGALPRDPRELDTLLDRAAGLVLAMKSDGPPHVDGALTELGS